MLLNNTEKMNPSMKYIDVLDKVQRFMSENYSHLLNSEKDERFDKQDERFKNIKSNIRAYLQKEQIECIGYDSKSTLNNDLFNSMCMYDFLTPYLCDDKFIIDNKIEEININSWDAIRVIDKNGNHLLDKHFPSKQKSIDFLTRIGTSLSKTANEGTPIFLGEIRKNIRIACTVHPVCDSSDGITASIRIVNLVNLTKDDLLNFQTANEQILNDLSVFISNGVNICVAGAVGSGKTGTTSHVLAEMLEKTKHRLIIIEIDSNEFNLQKFNENNRPIYDIVSWSTRESPDDRYSVTCDSLIELAMRYDPKVLAIGEMRNMEALRACEAASTGTTVITTTHSNNAVTAYDRIVDLCKKAEPNADYPTLYRKAIQSFPIIAYQEKLIDGSRKITEVIEGLEYKEGQVLYNTLHFFDIEDASSKFVSGTFKKGEKISNKLKIHLKKSVPKHIIDKM